MASAELMRLWKLAQIDLRLLEIRKRAGALDVGQKLQAEIDALNAKELEIGGHYRTLQQELTDLELLNKGIEDKQKKFEKELYGGKVVNSKEVLAIEKEIEMLKRQQGKNDERLLELFELVPPAKSASDAIHKSLDEKKAALVARRKAAVQERTQLEKGFAEANALRADTAKTINPTLLARYEDIRKRHAGIGMVEVDRRTSTCSGCGTSLPERSLQGLREDRTVSCETCHRILYYTEGLV